MPWFEIFAVFAVCHLVGDFGLQTDWQARHKHGGLGPDATARRALLAHVTTYTLAFVPALVWLGDELGAGGALGMAALIALPHLVQDDGRLVDLYIARVKHSDPANRALGVAVDQTFHAVMLLGAAVVAGT